MALIYLFVKPCWKSLCLHQGKEPLFVSISIIIAVTVSLGRPYARSISSMLPVCWRNLQTIVLPCANFFDDSIVCQNLWYYGSISLKTILIFCKNFINLWFDTIEKLSIINLISYRCKSYASVVLGDFKATFVREWEDAAFCSSFYCILFIYGVAKSNKS